SDFRGKHARDDQKIRSYFPAAAKATFGRHARLRAARSGIRQYGVRAAALSAERFQKTVNRVS
ncbi:MAG: hypothetical protein ACI4NG_04325, partial [Candidatus Gallimonas sp.]